jgi:PII-like signaling protein
VSDDALKLTIYYGESDRAGRGFLADALATVFARHELRTSLVMRGTTGFGAKQHLRTDRLLTLSEDLPLVSVAVDTRERIEAAHEQVMRLRFDGLVTLERARLLTGPLDTAEPPDQATKLTVYLGRGEPPGHAAVVDLLQRHGIAGADAGGEEVLGELLGVRQQLRAGGGARGGAVDQSGRGRVAFDQ